MSSLIESPAYFLGSKYFSCSSSNNNNTDWPQKQSCSNQEKGKITVHIFGEEKLCNMSEFLKHFDNDTKLE